jgi:hypothetical protein
MKVGIFIHGYIEKNSDTCDEYNTHPLQRLSRVLKMFLEDAAIHECIIFKCDVIVAFLQETMRNIQVKKRYDALCTHFYVKRFKIFSWS